MTTTDLNEYLPRLSALRDRKNHSVSISFSLWLHDLGNGKKLPPEYGWGIWDGSTTHTGATLHDALRAAENAAANDAAEPVDVLVMPERANYENA